MRRAGIDFVDGAERFPLGLAETVIRNQAGAEIVFEVVAIQFQRKLRVVEFGDDFLIHMQGLAFGIDDVQFEFRAESQIAFPEIRPLQ